MGVQGALALADDAGAAVESVVMQGDLSKLTAQQRIQYYSRLCQTLGLNPLTRPFDYLSLSGKLTLYAKRDATDQIRHGRGVSVTIIARERVEDLYIVTARATLPDGRSDESVGAVSIGGLKGENLANAIMKAETKAKRRVTLSIAGLGWMDESEVGSVAEARRVDVDMETGEVLTALPPADTAQRDDAPPTASTQPRQTHDTPAAGGPPASEAQRKALYAISRKIGATDEQMSALVRAYGVASSKEMTKAQASDLISTLKRVEDGKTSLAALLDAPADDQPTDPRAEAHDRIRELCAELGMSAEDTAATIGQAVDEESCMDLIAELDAQVDAKLPF